MVVVSGTVEECIEFCKKMALVPAMSLAPQPTVAPAPAPVAMVKATPPPPAPAPQAQGPEDLDPDSMAVLLPEFLASLKVPPEVAEATKLRPVLEWFIAKGAKTVGDAVAHAEMVAPRVKILERFQKDGNMVERVQRGAVVIGLPMVVGAAP